MVFHPWTITIYGLIPMAFALVGGLLSYFYVPNKTLKTLLQHFVSGIVLGAVAIQLLPKILSGHRLTVCLGFLVGMVFILLIHWISHLMKRRSLDKAFPLGLIIAILIDLFIDGALIAVAFSSGETSGITIAISLGFCAFFLSITAAMALLKTGRELAKLIIWIVIIAIMLPLGAYVGSTIILALPASWLTEILAFGVAALLYLACEELIGESHSERADTLWHPFVFFFGFLILLFIKL